jgi:hypothetical protein
VLEKQNNILVVKLPTLSSISVFRQRGNAAAIRHKSSASHFHPIYASKAGRINLDRWRINISPRRTNAGRS